VHVDHAIGVVDDAETSESLYQLRELTELYPKKGCSAHERSVLYKIVC
jgi:hydrogenase maturation factor